MQGRRGNVMRLRQLVISFVLSLALTTPAWSAIAFVQAARFSTCSSCTSQAVAYGSNVAAGSLLVACVIQDGTKSVNLVSTNATLQWYAGPTIKDAGNAGRVSIWYAPNAPAGATTVTATYSGANSFAALAIHEYSGAELFNAVADQTSTNDQANPGTGTDILTSGAKTTLKDAELIFGCSSAYSNPDGGTLTAGTNYTCRTEPFSAVPCAGGSDNMTEDRILTTAGSVAALWTQNVSATADYISAMVTFKPQSDVVCGFISTQANDHITTQGNDPLVTQACGAASSFGDNKRKKLMQLELETGL